MRTRLAIATSLLVLLVTAGLVIPAGAAPGDGPGGWTAERMAEAIPRDLVIDHRGLGYLRLPDGRLEPYGHATPAEIELTARSLASPADAPDRGRGRNGDGEGPSVDNVSPGPRAVIGDTAIFSADVSDPSGVRSVRFVFQTPNGELQSVSVAGSDGTYAAEISGFTPGDWRWWVVAADASSRLGEVTRTFPRALTVELASPGITDEPWELPGTVKEATGRLFFTMPYIGNTYADFICSGTVVTDETTGRSVVLTAAHCVYNDAKGEFATNVIFIPNQDETTAGGSDRDCTNDPRGCWEVSFGVVDLEYTTREFPANNEWDYAYYVVDDVDSHQGNGPDEPLDAFVDMPISFATPTIGAIVDAIGYSGDRDPDLRYCEEFMGEISAVNWFLDTCELTGGSSGGPWIQGPEGGDPNTFPIISVNSWGYTNAPGMAGPKLSGSSAACLFDAAKTSLLGADVIVDPATC